MQLSQEAHTARKRAQLARLAAKGSPEYPAIYAAQPEQIRIAKEQGAARKVIRDAKNAINTAALVAANVGAKDVENIATTKGAK